MADLGMSGLASGFDWKSFVDQMIQVQRAPETKLATEKSTITQQNNALSSIKTQMTVLSSRVDALKDTSLYETRSATSANKDIATVSSNGGSPLGTFALHISQLATAARQKGASNVGAALADSPDVTQLVLGRAGFSTDIKAGTFTVNGKQISIETTNTLQDVFNKINEATDGQVIGTYDPDTDKIVLTGESEVVLGSSTDTSNFLQVAKLTNNGTSDVESGGSLGGMKRAKTLAEANFATAITGDDTGAGEFKINGVSIDYSRTRDSLQNVLDRITNSAAGVTASYDSINDRFVLTSKTTGDQGISMEDVTGNFLSASGLSSGTLERGKNCLYDIDSGGQLSSASNTITEDSSGLTGLSISAVDLGTTQLTVATDTTGIKKGITDFISEYNNLQKLIDKNTASSTDSSGKVTAGLLAQDGDASEIASKMRAIVISSLTSSLGVKNLDALGIVTNGNDDTIELSDEDKLDVALGDNLSGVSKLFTDSTEGLAVKFASYIDKTTGDDGTLVAHQKTLTDSMSKIDDQVSEMERVIADQKETMTNKFLAMEQASAKSNQQLQFLQKNLA